jgi:hypothetical protein
MPDEDPFDFLDDAPPSKEAAEQIELWSKRKTEKKSRTPTVGPLKRRQYIEEADEMRRLWDWEGASGGHFVALYLWCHHEIYEVHSVDLDDSKAYAQATRLAQSMLENIFNGDEKAMLLYLQWVWDKERSREKARKVHPDLPGTRKGWRLIFGRYLLPDYQLEQHRRRSKLKGR